jgi:hypothetical protein
LLTPSSSIGPECDAIGIFSFSHLTTTRPPSECKLARVACARSGRAGLASGARWRSGLGPPVPSVSRSSATTTAAMAWSRLRPHPPTSASSCHSVVCCVITGRDCGPRPPIAASPNHLCRLASGAPRWGITATTSNLHLSCSDKGHYVNLLAHRFWRLSRGIFGFGGAWRLRWVAA